MEAMPIQAPTGGGTPTYTGVKTYSSDATINDEAYTSENGSENAILITGGNVTLSDVVISKTGDSDGEDADFYGTNAAILAKDDAKVTISDSEITTDGKHANAVFSYGNSKIDIKDTSITTESDNSGGIMVTGGGTINASDLVVMTAGNSSAAIRSDRGGGIINVEGGSYTTTGVGSPAIYSTADINVKKAILMTTASEGVVIEGHNSVTLDSSTVNATNNTLNGQSQTYKTIFIYQSMSGDASEGEGYFTADNSMIITYQGDHFYVTNTKAQINLSGNKFIQNDTTGAFLRAEAAAWGNSGSNGGEVFLNATNQEVLGDIITDSISSVDFRMTGSYFRGAITGEGKTELTVSADSTVVLTADSYVSSLTNATADNSNIYGNGFKLFVNGTEVATNTATAPESTFDEFCTINGDNCYEEESAEVIETTTTTTTSGSKSNAGFPVWGIVAIIGGVLIIVLAVILVVIKMKRKTPKTPEMPQPSTTPEAPATPGAVEAPSVSNNPMPSEEPSVTSAPNNVPPFGNMN